MKKHVKVAAVAVLILALVGGGLYFKKSVIGPKKQNFVGTLISQTTYKDDLAKVGFTEIKNAPSKVALAREKGLKNFSSNISSYCYTYADSDSLVMSKYFMNLKKDFDKMLNGEYKGAQNALLYIDMPKLIYDACKNRDTVYKERLIGYMQIKGSDFYVADRKREDENVKTFISKIEIEADGVDLAKLKTSPEYFNDIFYNKNLLSVFSLYYPYFEMTKGDVKRFTGKPINSLEEDNAKKEIALTKFYDLIKPMGYTIQEFRVMTLKGSGFSTNDELVASIVSDYKELNKIAKLDEYVGDIEIFNSTVTTGAYKKLFSDPKAKELVASIRKKTLMFSIILGDYADGINETWSGKQFFGDEKIGNGIIRLNILSVFLD